MGKDVSAGPAEVFRAFFDPRSVPIKAGPDAPSDLRRWPQHFRPLAVRDVDLRGPALILMSITPTRPSL